MKIEYVEGMGNMPITEVCRPTDDDFYYQIWSFDFPDLSHNGFDKYAEFLDEKIASNKLTVNNDVVALIHYPAETLIDKFLAEHMITLLAARVILCSEIKWSLSQSEKPGVDCCRINIFYFARRQYSRRDGIMHSVLKARKPNAKQKRTNFWDKLFNRLGWYRCGK